MSCMQIIVALTDIAPIIIISGSAIGGVTVLLMVLAIIIILSLIMYHVKGKLFDFPENDVFIDEINRKGKEKSFLQQVI